MQTSKYVDDWKALCAAENPSEAFFNHFSFLASTDEDREILQQLSENVLNITTEEPYEKLIVKLKYSSEDFENYTVEMECGAPFTGTPQEDVPKSYVKTSQVHNGICFESLGGGWIGFSGINKKGNVAGGNWEPEFLEEGGNEDFLEALEEKKLSASDVFGIIDYGQNWILSDPLKKTTYKERGYLFMSHEDCEAVTMEAANMLQFGSVLLRVFGQIILDVEYFEEIYD